MDNLLRPIYVPQDLRFVDDTAECEQLFALKKRNFLEMDSAEVGPLEGRIELLEESLSSASLQIVQERFRRWADDEDPPDIDPAYAVELYRHHEGQSAYYRCEKRITMAVCGRRSGKTGIAKRRHARKFISYADSREGYFVIGAPVFRQVRKIFWRDMKALIPRKLVDSISESELTIRSVTGAEMFLVGMDAPDRVEGVSMKHCTLDEFGRMKPSVWPENVRPALADLGGSADLLGVPELGSAHQKEMWEKADEMEDCERFHWTSASVLPPAEIESARASMDPLTFRQEFEAEFVTFTGRAYYTFDRAVHCVPCQYANGNEISFLFDFNVRPGVAVVVQETDRGTEAIGEVWIDANSNTEAVCDRLIAGWSHHKGKVSCYGDATGGATGTAKVAGSDWDIIRRKLKPYFPNLALRVPKGNPRERARVNAVNSRFMTGSGAVQAWIDPVKCPKLVRDFESVILDDTGKIDDSDKSLGHISDAFGYYVVRRFPVGGDLFVRM